jgi:adenine-specific DNA-methyltransferase
VDAPNKRAISVDADHSVGRAPRPEVRSRVLPTSPFRGDAAAATQLDSDPLMQPSRDEQPVTRGRSARPVDDSSRPELDLAALAVGLGATDTGGPLTPAELQLVRASGDVEIADETIERARDRLLSGDDPLGEAFYASRTPVVRRLSGAVYTPPSLVDPMVRWTLEQQPRRIIDAGAGSGRFAAAVARLEPDVDIVAVDLDPLATLMTRAALASVGHKRATVINGDYTKLRVGHIGGRTAYLGNPPYLRHHNLPPKTKAWAQAAAKLIGRSISGLAGLHALFYLATAHHGRDGDVGCFVTSAEWLDVNYGRVVRELLLENLGGEAIYVIEPESMPFGETATTAAVACFRVGTRPQKLRLHAVPSVEQLPHLHGGNEVARERLAASTRWSQFVRTSKAAPSGYVELGELCRVHRGAVTGANATWVRRREEVALPDAVLFASVTKARELFAAGERLTTLSGLRVVIDLPEDLDELPELDRKLVLPFLAAAKKAGVRKGYIASNRKAWWRVGLRDPAPILATYMARRPPAFVRNEVSARHINIAHGIYPRVMLSDGALETLAHALRTTVAIAAGRTYAGGLTKFEPGEMERLHVPDVTQL